MELWGLYMGNCFLFTAINAVMGPTTTVGLSKAARPGLERLLEARKRLQQLEEEKATGSDPEELHPRKLIWFT